MDNSVKYKKLKSEYDEKTKEATFIKGQISTLMERLKTEFDCSSIQEAEEKIKVLRIEKKEVEKKYENLLKKIEKVLSDEPQTD